MKNNAPEIKSFSRISLIPQGIIYIIFFLISAQFASSVLMAFIIASVTYLVLSKLSRNSFLKYHKNAIDHWAIYNYEMAISEFKASYEFFDRHKFLDKYRFVTMFDSSPNSYREMAIFNIAYCYGELGDNDAKEKCKDKLLELFPNGQIAKAILFERETNKV